MDLEHIGEQHAALPFAHLEHAVKWRVGEGPIAEDEHQCDATHGGVSFAAMKLGACHARPVVQGSRTRAGARLGLHLDVDERPIVEAHEHVEHDVLVLQTADGQLGVQDGHVDDGPRRSQHGTQQRDEQVAALLGGEQELEDDVELGIEQPKHEATRCTGDANGQRLEITPFAPPFGVAAPWRQVAAA